MNLFFEEELMDWHPEAGIQASSNFSLQSSEGDRTKRDRDFVYVITTGFLKIAKTQKNTNT